MQERNTKRVNSMTPEGCQGLKVVDRVFLVVLLKQEGTQLACVSREYDLEFDCFLPSLGEPGSHAMYPRTSKHHNRITPGRVSAVLLCSTRGNHQLFVQSLSHFLLSSSCLPGSLPLTLLHDASVTSQLSQCAFLFKLNEIGKHEKGEALQFSPGQDSFPPTSFQTSVFGVKNKLTWLRL